MDSLPTPVRLPLSRFERINTRDVDQARHVVAKAFCPHRLTALDSARHFETRFHATDSGDVSLSYLDYGGRVHIAAPEMETFYVAMIPLAGKAGLTVGREEARYDSSGAGVPPVDRAFDIHMNAGSPHLIVRITRDRLESHLRSILARPVTEPVRFTLAMNLAAPPAQSWRKMVDLLLDEVESGGPILDQPLALRETERLILTRLLLAQPNNYSGRLHEQPSRGTAPKAVHRAADLIEAHAAEPLTVEDIAEAVGVGVRTLQEGFRRHLDITPMNYLREVRLRHVREELAAADPTRTTVTETSIRWGFLHAGRFSAWYHERFGELPSVTLRH